MTQVPTKLVKSSGYSNPLLGSLVVYDSSSLGEVALAAVRQRAQTPPCILAGGTTTFAATVFLPRPAHPQVARTSFSGLRVGRDRQSAGTFTPTPVAPRINDQNQGPHRAADQQDHHPRLIVPKLSEAPGYFRGFHAAANLDQPAKRPGAFCPASASPVEGPFSNSIEVANEQDAQEGHHCAED